MKEKKGWWTTVGLAAALVGIALVLVLLLWWGENWK
jgi:hypothetical protein